MYRFRHISIYIASRVSLPPIIPPVSNSAARRGGGHRAPVALLIELLNDRRARSGIFFLKKVSGVKLYSNRMHSWYLKVLNLGIMRIHDLLNLVLIWYCSTQVPGAAVDLSIRYKLDTSQKAKFSGTWLIFVFGHLEFGAGFAVARKS